MCRMLGVVFQVDFPFFALNDLRELSEKGEIPGDAERGHRDGWGIVSFQNRSPLYVGRSERPAFMDPSYDSALEGIRKLETPNILIAHARAASQGGAKLANTHPFIAGPIVLGHNGTLYDFEPKTSAKSKGETDSEKLALLLADRMDEKRDLGSALKSLIREDIASHDFSAAILLVSDGTRLYGYRDFAKEDKANYYNLKVAKSKSFVAMFQETITGYEGDVSQVKKGELVSIDLDLALIREILL